MIRLFVAALGISASFSVQASSFTEMCGIVPTESVVHVFAEKGVTCASVRDFLSLMARLEPFLGKSEPASVFFRKRSFEASADAAGVLVLAQEQVGWEQNRSVRQRASIWSHEIGHLAFSRRLAGDFAPFAKFRDYLLDAKKLIVAAKDPAFDGSAQLQKPWSKEFGEARDLHRPYSELFGDLVAVLEAESPDAMRTAMTLPGMPEKKRADTRYYDFSGVYEGESWTNTDSHFFFAPVRAAIGKKFLKFPMNTAAKAALLDRVYSVALAEIRRQWANGKTLDPPAKANREFISRLEKTN